MAHAIARPYFCLFPGDHGGLLPVGARGDRCRGSAAQVSVGLRVLLRTPQEAAGPRAPGPIRPIRLGGKSLSHMEPGRVGTPVVPFYPFVGGGFPPAGRVRFRGASWCKRNLKGCFQSSRVAALICPRQRQGRPAEKLGENHRLQLKHGCRIQCMMPLFCSASFSGPLRFH